MEQSRLKEIFHYDPETGDFVRLKKTSGKCSAVGSVCKALDGGGYINIRIDGKRYGAHRLAFLYMTGKFPETEVDHINRVRKDNRWRNLRIATPAQQRQNADLRSDNKSGYVGVWRHSSGSWVAMIGVQGRNIHLGSFKYPEDASAAYIEAKRIYHPFSH